MEAVNQGHIFFIVQSKRISMLKLRNFVMAKKIAFVILLRAIGDYATTHQGRFCCGLCGDPQFSNAKLSFERYAISDGTKRRRCTAVWDLKQSSQDVLKKKLIDARKRYIQEHPSFMMLGENFVCPDSVIESICKQSKFIEYPGDLDDIFGLRPDLRPTFYKIIIDVLQNSPIEPKRRKVSHR